MSQPVTITGKFPAIVMTLANSFKVDSAVTGPDGKPNFASRISIR